MNPYTISYAIGYYYGRSGAIVIAEQDRYHQANAGFDMGYEAGQRDFQDVDLPMAAEAMDPVDVL
jgi:hypothetical protein